MLDWLALGLLLHYPLPADQNAGTVVSASSSIEIVTDNPNAPAIITLYQPVHDCLKLIVELLDRIKPNAFHPVPLHTRHQGAGFDIDRDKLGPNSDYDVVWVLEALKVRGKLQYWIEDEDSGKNKKDKGFFHVTAPSAALAQTKKLND